jgi:hypothetical protein
MSFFPLCFVRNKQEVYKTTMLSARICIFPFQIAKRLADFKKLRMDSIPLNFSHPYRATINTAMFLFPSACAYITAEI